MLPRRKIQFRRTTLMTAGLVAFLVGLALARIGFVVPIPGVLLGFVLVLALARGRTWQSLATVVTLGLLAGGWRGAAMLQRIAPYQQLYGKQVVLRVTAGEDATYGFNSQLTFETHHARATQPLVVDLPGRIKVSGFGENAVFKGDVVEVKGKLQPTRGGRQAQIGFVQMTVIERGNNPIDTVRREFVAGTYNALPEPVASFGLGILIGQRTTLPDDVSKQLAAVGLTHIIAVSGYNLTIIVDAVRRLMKHRSKYQTVLSIAILVTLFLAITGLSASIVRASLISALSISAWYYGRTFKPLLLISLAAAVTAGWNPLYLWGDIGWYLSFLAFFGVLVIAPLVMRRIYGKREPKFVQAVLIETVSAQIMTIPLILYIFQQMSGVSIISNLLIVPLIPVAMLITLVAGLAGMWLPAIVGWFAWPARILLTYILDVAATLSKVPHALAHYTLSVTGLVGMYLLLLAGTAVLWRKTPKFVTITDENIED